MSVETGLEHLKNYSKYLANEDLDFKEFIEKLSIFVEKYKNQININNSKNFIETLKKYLENNQDSKEYNDFIFNQFSNFVLENEKNGFIDLKSFHNNFNMAKNKINLDNFSYEELEKEELINSIKQELNLNDSLFKNKNNLEKEIQNYKKNIENNEFLEPVEKEEQINSLEKEEINPTQLINFIKNEEEIYFPFNKEDTLNDFRFMSGFVHQLKKISNDELKIMIENLKKKNEAIQEEIKNLQNEKNELYKQIKNELQNNSELTILKEQNQEEIKNYVDMDHFKEVENNESEKTEIKNYVSLDNLDEIKKIENEKLNINNKMRKI